MSADISCWCQQGQRLRWSELRQRAVPRQDSHCCSADALICSCPAAFNCNRVSRLPGNPPMIEGVEDKQWIAILILDKLLYSSYPIGEVNNHTLWLLRCNYLFWVCLFKTIFLMKISAYIRGWESFSFLSMSNNNLKMLFVTLITTPHSVTYVLSQDIELKLLAWSEPSMRSKAPAVCLW